MPGRLQCGALAVLAPFAAGNGGSPRRALGRSRAVHALENALDGSSRALRLATPKQTSGSAPIWASPDRFAVRQILGKALGQTWRPLRTPVEKYRTKRRTTPGPRRCAGVGSAAWNPDFAGAALAKMAAAMCDRLSGHGMPSGADGGAGEQWRNHDPRGHGHAKRRGLTGRANRGQISASSTQRRPCGSTAS